MEFVMGYNDMDHTARADVCRPVSEVEQIIADAVQAYQAYSKLNLSSRQKILAAIKSKLIPMVTSMAVQELEATGMGNTQDKIVKLMLSIHKTPGVEDLVTDVQTGDDGMTLFEYSAYGVICSVQPATNPCATLIGNTLGMLAAGNAVIHIPHPRCVALSRHVARQINEAVLETCGIANLVSALPETSMQVAEGVMNHPDVAMVVVTGGGKMLSRALSSSKRVIGAGPANPVVIVDETAYMEKAARDIVDGASFDHNIMCLSEKNIVVTAAAAGPFVEALKREKVYYVTDEMEMLLLTKAAVTRNLTMNRALEGKSANEILAAAGIPCKDKVRLIVVDTVKTHPFATLEMMMPLVPLIRVPDFDTALETALFIEQGNRHTAMIHSQSMEHLNEAARVMQTSVFIKNGSSLVGIGFNGEGTASFTIANTTGEGVTTARHFARRRRCTLTTGFSIR